MEKNYYTLDEAASFLTDELCKKITPDDVLRTAASRESGLDLCIYFHGALEFQQENTEEGGLWPSFCISNNFRGYIKIPVDAIHPDKDNFSPFPYARVIEELSNGILASPSAEKVLFPTLYARRIEPIDSCSLTPFHPQDATTLTILFEPLAHDLISTPFVASRSKALITGESLFNFLYKNKESKSQDEMFVAQDKDLTRNRKTNKLRRDCLDPVIDKAINTAGNTENADVFLQLKELALNEHPPFNGTTNKGALCYTNDNDEPGEISKAALAQRLKRRLNTINNAK